MTLSSSQGKFLLSLTMLAGLVYAALCFVHYRAGTQADTYTEESLARAIRLEPSNADYEYRLGNLQSLALQEPEKAIAHYERAIALNQYSGEYWLKLSLAYRILGEDQKEREALIRGLEAEPKSWEVMQEAAMQYLTTGDLKAAFPLYRVMMQKTPYQAYTIIPMLLRTAEPARVLDEAVPSSSEVYTAFIGILLNANRYTDAQSVAERALREQRVPDKQMMLALVAQLLKNRRWDDATKMWNELGKADVGWRQYAPQEGIVNGGFELPLLKNGFDWRLDDIEKVEIRTSRESPAVGEASLAMSFAKTATPARLLWTFVPLREGSNYSVRYRYRSSALASASMPRVSVMDACTEQVLYTSDEMQNATTWQQKQGTFQSKACPMARLEVTRAEPEKLITGDLWLDDFGVAQK